MRKILQIRQILNGFWLLAQSKNVIVGYVVTVVFVAATFGNLDAISANGSAGFAAMLDGVTDDKIAIKQVPSHEH